MGKNVKEREVFKKKEESLRNQPTIESKWKCNFKKAKIVNEKSKKMTCDTYHMSPCKHILNNVIDR